MKIEVTVRPGGPPARGRAGFRFSRGPWSQVNVDTDQREKIENDPYLMVRRPKKGAAADEEEANGDGADAGEGEGEE